MVREGELEAHGRKHAGKLVACSSQLAASPSISECDPSGPHKTRLGRYLVQHAIRGSTRCTVGVFCNLTATSQLHCFLSCCLVYSPTLHGFAISQSIAAPRLPSLAILIRTLEKEGTDSRRRGVSNLEAR